MIARHCWLGPALLFGAVVGCSGGASPSYGGGTGGSGAPGATPGAGSNGVAGLGGTQQAGGAPSASNPKVSGGGAPGTGGTASGAGGASGGPVANGTGGAGSTAAAAFPAGDKTSHLPLVDGASWTYHHTKPMTAAWDEIDTVHATTYMSKPAFIFEDQEDAMGVQTHSTLIIEGTGVYRAYKEVSIKAQTVLTVTYKPEFLRFDEAWTQAGQKVSLTDNWTQNCMLGGTIASKCTAGTTTPGMTTHDFTVLNTSVKVTVPAGTFDTVEIQRVDPNKPETKLFWFAAGVGKVREEVPATMSVTELTAYKIP